VNRYDEDIEPYDGVPAPRIMLLLSIQIEDSPVIRCAYPWTAGTASHRLTRTALL